MYFLYKIYWIFFKIDLIIIIISFLVKKNCHFFKKGILIINDVNKKALYLLWSICGQRLIK